MSEKLCLQWNDFKDNIKTAFANLREDNDFADVTLACEDGQQVEAHKVILAASSPFFQKLLGRNKHPHPLIYLRGMKYEEITAIVDFLYFGEANVYQENLDSFLAIAEEFQLKGLVGKTNEKVEDLNEKYLPQTFSPAPIGHKDSNNFLKGKTSKSFNSEENMTVAIPDNFSGDFQELEEKLKSMMEKSGKRLPHRPNVIAYICKVCGKQGQGNAIKDHIEANHLEGISLPCNFCDKTFRSTNSLRMHKTKMHL